MAMATGSHQFGNHNWSNSSNDLLLMWTIGSILALNAGMINATTVSESKALSTSPMTGICALVGVSLGRRNWVHFQQSVGILISHILGASLPGYSMPDHLWVRILLGSLILLSASMTNIFSPNSIFFYYFAAMFTGLQNSLTSR